MMFLIRLAAFFKVIKNEESLSILSDFLRFMLLV